MLSRIANSARGSVRRYTTSNSSGGASGGARPNYSAQTSSLGSQWLATKRRLDAGSFGTRLACAVVFGVSSWALYDQYRNANHRAEMLTAVENLDRHSSLDVIAFMHDAQGTSRALASGLEAIPELIMLRRRSFSGDVIFPIGEDIMEKYEARLIGGLLNAADDQYENRWRALSLLHVLARSNAAIRKILREPNNLFRFLEYATFLTPESSPRHEWVIAADLVTLLLKDPEAASALQDEAITVPLSRYLDVCAQSKNPVVHLLASRLAADVNMPFASSGFSRAVETNMIQQALADTIAIDYSRANVGGASLYSALGFAIFGGIWGRFRWAMRLTRFGALNAHAWSWSAKKHIARPLALWFMADMLGTRLLTFASNEKFEFDPNTLQDLSDIEARANLSSMSLTKSLQQFSGLLSTIPGTSNVSLATFLSITQNISFTLFGLWMISTRRYAFLPLAAAGIYNHYDEIKKIPQVDYVVSMGKMQADQARNFMRGKIPVENL